MPTMMSMILTMTSTYMEMPMVLITEVNLTTHIPIFMICTLMSQALTCQTITLFW